jgi:outer membrane protein with beta-barrel domain
MKKTMTVTATIAGLLIGATTSFAQTPSPRSPGEVFVNLSAGGQFQDRSFGSSGTFSSFNETGSYETRQNIGSAFVFDASGGYQFAPHMAVGGGIWLGRAKSAASGAAIMPDPVFFGRFTTITPTPPGDMNQNMFGVNFQFIYTVPLNNRIDFALSGGPTILHVSQDVASISVSPTASTAAMSVDSQSATTAKAGNVGLDISYKLAEEYGVGFFIRYAGGEVDLPAVSNLKVGGLQFGGGVRFRF